MSKINVNKIIIIYLNIAKYPIKTLSEYIRIYCRFRPSNEYELTHSTNNSVILLSPRQLIVTQEKK